MGKMSYEEFSGYVNRGQFQEASNYNSIVYVIENYIGKEKVKIFYPKNLFIDDLKLEAFVFQNDKVSVAYEIDNEVVNLKVLKYSDINKIEMLYSGYYNPMTLKISFNTGDEIELNDKEDTNSTWSNQFTKKIEEIVKLIG